MTWIAETNNESAIDIKAQKIRNMVDYVLQLDEEEKREVIIHLAEQVEAYRVIGTVEECEDYKRRCKLFDECCCDVLGRED